MIRVVQIARDPFARLDIVRRVEPAGRSGCAWCGQRRRGGKLYRYGVWHDAGRLHWGRELFCSRPCSRAVHGGA